MYRWKEQVDSGTYPRWEAMKIIEQNTIQRFHELRCQGIILHDADLQQILLEEAKKINYFDFQVLFLILLIYFRLIAGKNEVVRANLIFAS